MKTEFLRLKLISPLLYISDEAIEPFSYAPGSGERLFCFELDKKHAQEFEPDISHFPGSLICSGRETDGKSKGTILGLSKGDYIFTQVPDILNREEVVLLAMDLQNEGLWQRLELAPLYYLRYLSEDNHGVTQLFRPCISAD